MIDDLIDPDFQTYSSLQSLKKDFPEKNNLLLIIKNKKSGINPTSSELCDLLAWISKVKFEISGIEKIYSTFGIHESRYHDRNISFMPILRPSCGTYENDTLEQAKVNQELKSISRSAYGAFLSSKDANDLLVTFYLSDQKLDPKFGNFNYQMVEVLQNHLQNYYLKQHPEMEAIWGGNGFYQYHLKKGFDESLGLNIISALLMLFLFWLIYGTFKSGFIFQITLLFSTVLVYGIMGIFGWPIDNLSNVLPTLILVSTLEDFVFLSHYRKTLNLSLRASIWKLTLPSFFTSLTTAIGFGSLTTSNLSMVRRFGIECALGALLEWLALILILPALIQFFPKLSNWIQKDSPLINTFANKINHFKPNRFIAYGSLACFAMIFLFHHHLNINDAPDEIFNNNHPVTQSMNYFKNSRGWKFDSSLVFHDYSAKENNLEILERIKASDPLISGIENPYAIRDEIGKNIPAESRNVIENQWDHSPLSSRLVSESSNHARALLFLRSTDIIEINRFRARIEHLCKNACHLAGTLISYGEFGEQVLQTLLSSLFLSLIQVSIILWLLNFLLKQNHGIGIIFASIWGTLALLCFYLVFQVKVFFVTSIIASIVIGIAGDNPIQFMFYKKRRGSLSSGIHGLAPASLTLFILMASTTSVLLFSSLSFLRTMSALMILGLFLMYLGDVYILKCFLKPKTE